MNKSITFFAFNFGPSSEKQHGGTGVFLSSIVSILDLYHKNGKVRLNVINITPDTCNNVSKIIKFSRVIKLYLKQMFEVLTARSKILIFVYPKMPVIAFTDKIEYQLVAFIGYLFLWVKKYTHRTKVIIIIEELVIEQLVTLKEDITFFKKFQTEILEHFLFQMADTLLAPSELMSRYIDNKYNLKNSQWIIYPRDMYLPLAGGSIIKNIRPQLDRINVLYSGGMGKYVEYFLYQIIDTFEESEKGFLYLCGIDGDWVGDYINQNKIQNSRYVDILNYKEHDYLASNCDFGLIVYPERLYFDFKPTTKYSAYVTNGLAVLSVSLKTLKKILREDGTGKTVESSNYIKELDRWLSSKDNFKRYKENANKISEKFKQGYFMKYWMDKIIESHNIQ